jgi:hypothetical protein
MGVAAQGAIVQPRQRSVRPPACRECSARSWWNGWRLTFPTVAAETAGAVERWEQPVPRAKCSGCKQGFTCRPPGLYPRRQFQLDVVAKVVAAIAVGAQSAARAAKAAGASATSGRRWLSWVAGLARPGELLAAAAQIDPDAPAGAGLSLAAGDTLRARAARVLAALEQLGCSLVRCGLAAARSGLGRVLGWQLLAHGDVYGLLTGETLSPGMALTGPEGHL